MHLHRWITSLIALPLLFWIIYGGGPLVFALLIAVVSLIGLWEYLRIVLGEKSRPASDAVSVIAFIVGPGIVFCAYIGAFETVLWLLVFNLIGTGAVSLFRFRDEPAVSELVTRQVAGLIYIPLLLSYLVMIRNSVDGISWIVFLICIVFAGDTGAFYAGTYLGKRKLLPSVSPGKTVEGSIGGLLGSLAVGCGYKALFLPGLAWWVCIVMCPVVGATGQAGDLFESAFKRYYRCKDSGRILPGHGGILDRIDALLFAAPIGYFFKIHLS